MRRQFGRFYDGKKVRNILDPRKVGGFNPRNDMRVILRGEVRADGIIHVGQIAEEVVTVNGVALGGGPAIGQPSVGIEAIAEDFRAGGVHLVGGTAVFVVIPGGDLVLAGERRSSLQECLLK